ncbi:glycine zipper 2TM domain-containing protein [Neisseriaceae bacterium TC5R-5]|nr:glycine zipper 2TM domain-containing protein [Neisseriaceae bacterium TC5R-5]
MRSKLVTTLTVTLLGIATLSGCATMSERDRNTAVGAAGGAIVGSAVSRGDTGAILGGAVIGGVVGRNVGGK